MPDGKKTSRKLQQLRALLAGKGNLLIVLQDRPDPDALAAAAALREVAHFLADAACSISCGASVLRAENRALLRYMGLHLRPIEQVDFRQYDVLAMVDTQPGQGNNALSADVHVHCVIDHHPMQALSRSAEVHDIRRQYGAASSILHEYLVLAGVKIEPMLATALLYGIVSDTQDLGRESTQADMAAYRHLYPLANKRMLATIRHGDVPTEYYRVLASAIQRTRVCGKCIYCDLGEVSNPDMIPEVADLLLRHEEMMWSLCWGEYHGLVLLSLRSDTGDPRADVIMRAIVHRKGTGGGHRSMAGGQISLDGMSAAHRRRLDALLRARFLRSTGNEKAEDRKLL